MPVQLKYSIEPPIKVVVRPFYRDIWRIADPYIGQLAEDIQYNVQQEAPERTGALRRAIVKKKVKRAYYVININPRSKAAKYEAAVREGVSAARRNPIVPSKKLALYWPSLPHPIAIVRNHPGLKANPYPDRGLSRSSGDIKRATEGIGKEIAEQLTH